MAGIRPYQHPRGGTGNARVYPLGAAQTYDAGDPVMLSSNQLIATPKDGSEALDDELIGFATEPATGILAGSRSFTGQGAIENQFRGYIPVEDEGQLYVTDNWWDDVTGLAQTGVPDGTDIGDIVKMTSAAAGDWGLVDAAATVGTHIACKIVMILDANGNPINADDTTNGVSVVFRVVNQTNSHQGDR